MQAVTLKSCGEACFAADCLICSFCVMDAQASRNTPNVMFNALLCIADFGSFLILSVIM